MHYFNSIWSFYYPYNKMGGKGLSVTIMEEQMVKMIEFAEMAKLTVLNRERLIKFNAEWKSLFEWKWKEMNLWYKVFRTRKRNSWLLKNESSFTTIEQEVNLHLFLELM